jgi:hypothetical protein
MGTQTVAAAQMIREAHSVVGARGRHLLASTAIPAGTCLFTEHPLVAMGVTRRTGEGHGQIEMCDWCGTPAHCALLRRCARCRRVSWCSAACQDAATGGAHGQGGECEAIVLASKALTARGSALDEVPHRFLLRILSTHSWQERLGRKADVVQMIRRQLIAHLPAQDSNDYLALSAIAKAMVESLAATKLADIALECGVAGLIELMCCANRNTVSLHVGEEDSVMAGVAICLQCAAINHSCVPNAEIHNVGTVLHVRAVTHIAPGDELTISYVPEWKHVNQRRRELARQYKFDCSCRRCDKEQRLKKTAPVESKEVVGYLEMPGCEPQCWAMDWRAA